ncbi:iron ABC transporter permease [Bradyrhizobium manausense]|uniref:lipocalin-like domain-containing protein n=1 Tax=Bradyrhizobium TaxID=374 RepID=UPI001BAA9792|nr:MULTISPECIES: lipocalin-like domain-containing protein [Bradyrhizobium]MBR0829283.1 iron ABC transporter permease [Bradyrhizobium manausense]UVO29795.1 iron ABC transporter permease [Bradyrhizobium arachidis]
MSGDRISRRAFAGGLAALTLPRQAFAQGYAGLGETADGFAPVVPGKTFAFPADHGPHPDFRIEWWYLTANLVDATGAPCGLQWTLFRQAAAAPPQREGWANQHIWMAHAAVTRADTHRFSELFARGGVGQAGVTAKPFAAWIDAWEMKGTDTTDDRTLAPVVLKASAANFSYALTLQADRAVVLQGDAGFSRKSERGQASYYYSQPFFRAQGTLTVDDKTVDVSGQAWMDREWSSQPLASDQTGWDWLSLHLSSGDKLMLYRLRQKDGQDYPFGNWIAADGSTEAITGRDIQMTPKATAEVAGRKLPVEWQIAIPSRSFLISCKPLNSKAWMGTGFSYWEGPISFAGTHNGVGYLELTGY